MEKRVGVFIDGVTINFTVKGADPNNKLPPDAECAICGMLIAQHSPGGLPGCGKQHEGNVIKEY